MNSKMVNWRKSSRCGSSTCVEVAKVDGQYLVRNSKNWEDAPLAFTQAEWIAAIEIRLACGAAQWKELALAEGASVR
jgi:hypothetical protein